MQTMDEPPVCPKCSSAFGIKDNGRNPKRPLLLNCGHTFCESCLLHLARGKKSILCPNCKEETIVPKDESGVRMLCTDRYLIGKILQSRQFLFDVEINKLKTYTDGVTKKFGKCTETLCKECCKRQATTHCTQCNASMCSECYPKVHNLSRSLRQHVAVPISDMIDEVQLAALQTCQTHVGRQFEYYCEDHDTLVCSRCVIVGEHKGHNISSIEDKNRAIVNEMEPNLQMASCVFRRLKKMPKMFPSLVPDYKKEMIPALRAIWAHFQRLHGWLQVQEQALENNVVESAMSGLEKLGKLSSHLEKEYKDLDQTIKVAQRCMNNTDDVVVNAKGILEKLVLAKDIPCILEPCSLSDNIAKIEFIPNTDAMTRSLGEVKGTLPQMFELHTMREMPEKFSEDEESLASTESMSMPSTPLDTLSIASDSHSEDIIIEEEHEVLLNEDGLKLEEHVNLMQKKTKSKIKLPPNPTKFKGQNENIIVTHLHSPNDFVVQLKRDQAKVTSMLYKINTWCNSAASKKYLITEVAIGDYLLAQFSRDKQWYRARAKHVIDHSDPSTTTVEVLYFDFGNTEVVPLQRLRQMQSKFMKYQDFAIECSLYNLVSRNKEGTWSCEAVSTFAKMVEDKTMLLTVVQEENHIKMVDLSKPADDDITDDRPISVRDALIFMELANMKSPYSLPEPDSAVAPKRNYITPSPKEEGQMYPVMVSYAGTPCCFYVQELGEENLYLATLMAHIQDTYTKQNKDSWQIIYPQIGMICVCQFTGDGIWYRARIVELPGDKKVVVQYVDYGNSETVGIFSLRKILDSFLILPEQAITCCLEDVQPSDVDEGWSIETLQYWADLVTMQKYVMKVISISRRHLGVVLREPDMDDMYLTVNIKIVKDSMAVSSGKWSEPQDTCVVETALKEVVPRLSYQAGNGSFPEPCDLGHQPVYWKSRNTRPTRRYEETVLTPPDSPTERPKHAQPRPQPEEKAAPVSPALPRSPKTPTKSTAEFLLPSDTSSTQSSPPSSGTVTPVARSPLKSNAVILQTPKAKKPHKQEKPTELEAKVTHFVSPSEFYLQVADAGKLGLDQLMQDMQRAFQNTEYQWLSWKKGTYCAAFSANTGYWYRAKIVKVLQKTLMEVYMLDFGFTEIMSTTNLRSILHQFRKHRCFSFCCKLGGVTPAGGMKDWSKTACEFMQDQIVNKKLFLSKRGNADGGKLPIDLIVEEYIEETALEPGRRTFHSIIDMMKDKGLAIPLPKSLDKPVKDDVVYPVLYYKKAEAEVKTGDQVMPVYIDYDAVIHCYTMTGDDVFQAMCDTLQQKFKYSDVPKGDQSWEKGQACAALFDKDETWHRATIQDLQPDKVQILFIDYGNSEWVEYEQLRADIAEFTDIPQQTFLCTLHDIKSLKEDESWDVRVIEHMHRDLVNKYCKVTIVEKNGYTNKFMSVHLELNEKDYGAKLVQYGLAARGHYITDQEMLSQTIEKMLQENNPYQTIPPLKVGETCHYLVTHMELPNVVYVQNVRSNVTAPQLSDKERSRAENYNKQLDNLETMSLDLSQSAHTLAVIRDPKPGMACVAKFGLDQCWYRALVISLYQETSQLMVLFVDYGNCEVITMNKLRALPQNYMSLPCQSQRSLLANVEPAKTIVSWTKTSLLKMMETTVNAIVTAKVTCVKPLLMELYVPGSDDNLVYQSVIDAGYVVYNTTSPMASPASDKASGDMPAKADIAKMPRIVEPIVEVKLTDCSSTETNETPDSNGTNIRSEVSDQGNLSHSGSPRKIVDPEELNELHIETDNTAMASCSVETVIESLNVSAQSITSISPSTKSWADMVDDSLDIDHLPDLDSGSESGATSETVPKTDKRPRGARTAARQAAKNLSPDTKKQLRKERRKERESHVTVKVTEAVDECFD